VSVPCHFERLAVAVVLTVGVSCSGGDGGNDAPVRESSAASEATTEPFGSVLRVDPPQFILDVGAAIAAVEQELGGPQEYFEVTANDQLTNVFVAVDEATATVGYVFVDGALQAPLPKQDGATGKTFTAADVDFDPTLVTGGVANDLSDATIDAFSVYGNGSGAVYILAASSTSGGSLDIEVGPQGDVRSVDPV
jgi:hypothetical protein